MSTSDASIYVITYGRSPDIEGVRLRLNRLAEATGGRSHSVQKPDDLNDVFRRVIEDLSQHYLLGYTPIRAELDGSTRKIEVKLTGKQDRYEVRARSEYRAVAVSLADGPAEGLELVDRIEGLDEYHLLHSTRGNLLGRLGREDEARDACARALELASNDVERSFLVARVNGLQRN